LKTQLLLAVGVTLSLSAFAQLTPNPLPSPDAFDASLPCAVVSRSVQAVNYQHRSGSSKLDFRRYRPDTLGEWRSWGQQQTRIHRDRAEFGKLQKLMTFGIEYLTYVLWAISPKAGLWTWAKSCSAATISKLTRARCCRRLNRLFSVGPGGPTDL